MTRKRVSAKPITHDFKKEKEVEGVLISVDKDRGDYHSTAYTLQTDKGERLLIWGNKVLDDQLSTVSVGSYVWITFLGEKKSKKGGNKPYKDYSVDFDPESVKSPDSEDIDVPEDYAP